MTDLLRVSNLRVDFVTQAGVIRAVDDVSFRIRAGSSVALVSESIDLGEHGAECILARGK